MCLAPAENRTADSSLSNPQPCPQIIITPHCMWCDSFNAVLFCGGFIRHAVGSFETANPMEQSVRFPTMGPRRSYEAEKTGGRLLCQSLSKTEARQCYISLIFQGHMRKAVASAFSMTSRKSIAMRTACEIDLTRMWAPSFLSINDLCCLRR